MSTSRERFQRWLEEVPDDEADVYENSHAQIAWEAWQARDSEVREIMEALKKVRRQVCDVVVKSDTLADITDPIDAVLSKYAEEK